MNPLAATNLSVYNNQMDIDLTTAGLVGLNSCTGELLTITSGIVHIDLHETINNTKLSLEQHTNTRNLKMVNPVNGAVYSGTSSSKVSENVSLLGGTVTLTQVNTAMFTTPGGKNNSEVKYDLHITFNANGNVTAQVDNFRSGCK